MRGASHPHLLAMGAEGKKEPDRSKAEQAVSCGPSWPSAFRGQSAAPQDK